MKLFLTSSGLSDINEKDFLGILDYDLKNLRVAFISTAMNGESEESRNKWIPISVANLEKLGLGVDIIELEKLDEKNIVSTFKPFNIIYVFGGNTFYLMYYANQSGFTKHIKEIIKDKIYFGISAGSVIAGPDVSLSQWGKDRDRNIIGLKDMRGLNLVPFSVIPHWKGQSFIESKDYPYEVRYIKDGEVIMVNKE